MAYILRHPLVASVLVGMAVFTPCFFAQAAISDIEQVTIYQGMASVTRSLPFNTSNSLNNGEQLLVFSCLSPNIEADSISVQAPDAISIGEVSVEQLSGDQAKLCQYQGDKAVRQYSDVLEDIKAQLDAAQLAKAYLDNLTKAVQVQVEGTISSQTADLEQQAVSVNKRLLQLQQQQAKAQDDLNRVMASGNGTLNNAVTQISVRAASRTGGKVTLHYQVQGAGWQPTYQARLNTDTQQLTLTASAVIAQQTGENWLNVPLTLSSVNPNQKTASALPDVTLVSLYDKPDFSKSSVAAAPSVEAYMPVIVMAKDRADEGYGGASPNTLPLPSFNVNSSNKNGLSEYRLAQRVSIPSDGRRIRTTIDQLTGTSETWLRSTPSKETKAYWYASAPFLTPAWADGDMQLYRDDTYIGQSRYGYQALKEQGIGFGVDPNIIVKQLTDADKQSDSGVFNRTKQLTVTEAYQLTNQHTRPVTLEVLGDEPISQDDNIKVAVTHTPPITTAKWDDKPGIVAWRFTLAPKQSQVVQTSYTLSYPADKLLQQHQ